jgi:hypothetical protein
VAQILNTANGQDIDWATSDGTTEEGELLGENTETSEEDVSFGGATLGAKKLSSKIIRVSNELLQDSGVDIEAFLAARIATRIGRGEAKYLVLGTGTGTPLQPKGLAASVTGTKNTAAATTFTWKELNALKHSVDPAYRNGQRCAGPLTMQRCSWWRKWRTDRAARSGYRTLSVAHLLLFCRCRMSLTRLFLISRLVPNLPTSAILTALSFVASLT